jgi:hypothetical protein
MNPEHPRQPLTPPTIFPPRRDYASLSIKDLLDARDAYRLQLSSLDNVVATAVGRYFIHKDDWYAKNPPTKPRPPDYPKVSEPRTLANSVIRPWSWPAVLVFVRSWADTKALGDNAIPRSLFLPDGRIIPTCVVEAKPDESLPGPSLGPFHTSPLLGGGYSCLRQHQGMESYGTISCLVKKGGSFYALTNRHVAGGEGENVSAYIRSGYESIGTSSGIAVDRQLMSSVFPRWPGANVYLTLDAGLVRIDDINDWTAQVYGIGEIGELFNATEYSLTLDLIGCPLRAFGATSGILEGQIAALFFQYETASAFSYGTDVLIGPRPNHDPRRHQTVTQSGDSGAIWFFDWPAYQQALPANPDLDSTHRVDEQRGVRARRFQPIVMQWGGQRIVQPNGTSTAYALGSFLSTICRSLDIDIVRDWSLGHEETWGKIGHFSIGFKACSRVRGQLGILMKANQNNIGVGDDKLGAGAHFTVDKSGFVPLADVPDYVWVPAKGSHPNESIQHFADIDIEDINGGESLLEKCVADPNNVSASVWKNYFDGFAEQGVGPEDGALPLRVWQLWEAMVSYLQNKDILRFVGAAGVMAHYVGDASQPLHCSYMHHGKPPMLTFEGREYPVPRGSDEFKKFKTTREAQIHSIYEETMLEVDPAGALVAVDAALEQMEAPNGNGIATGHDAAVAVIQLMHRSQQRLSPTEIIEADDPSLSPKARAKALWNIPKIKKATIDSLADSVQVLASLWSAAWKIGNGRNIDPDSLVELDKGKLTDLCRKDRKFVPSLSLAQMASSGQFEPSAELAGSGSARQIGPSRHARR